MLKERDTPCCSESSPGTPPSTAAATTPRPDHCAGCNCKILDRYYLLAVERRWHAACLRCCRCGLPLDAELTCYSRDGNIYCKEDYYRSFCGRCGRCGGGIAADELVMRARELVFHPSCFTCVACGTRLCKGDVFGMRDGLLYCRHHYHCLCLDTQPYGRLFRCEQLSGGDSPQYYVTQSGQNLKGRPRKKKLSPGSPEDMQTQPMPVGGNALEMLHGAELSSSLESLGYESSGASPGSVGAAASARTKRMRTSFKHHQLRTMKSYFAINQNPDAKDLKQLAQKTGLSKRVLQVWFQNARAKWRRNMMRQESNAGVSALASGPGPGGLLPEPLQPLDSAHSHPQTMLYSDLY